MTEPSSNQPPLMGYASLSDFRTASRARRLRRLLVRWLVRAAIGFAMLVAFTGLFQLFMIGPLSAGMGIIACLVCTAVAAGCLRTARRQRAIAVLSYCEQGARLHAPLPEFLRAIAMNESARAARRLISIAVTLEAPASLGSAIVSELPELPLRFGELLRAAESNGTLVPTLTRLVREEETASLDRSVQGPMTGAYIAITLLALAIPANLIIIFVMPKIVAISRDFGVPLPWSWSLPTLFGVDTLGLLMLVLVVAALAVVTAVLINNAQSIFFRRREYDRPFKAIGDRVLWYVPIIGSMIRDRDWADVCQSIADGLDQHRPIDTMPREAAATQHLSDVTATRLEDWWRRITSGEPLSKAASAARLPALVYGLIGEGSQASDALAPVFAFLARHYRGRTAQRGAWLAAAATPLLTLVCGAVVTAFALFLWLPLTRLIDAVNQYPMRL